MGDFNYETASSDELWDYLILEYQNPNPVFQYLFNGYFHKIYKIIDLFDESDQLLDVGCGPGVSSLRIKNKLKSQHFEVSDHDERIIRHLKEMNFPLPVKQESVLEMQREDRSFDCVFLLEVLEHLEQFKCALDEIFRVSRKYVVISVPNEPLWSILNMMRGKYIKDMGNTPGHINHWCPRSLRSLVEEYGNVIKIYTPIPWIVLLAEIPTI